MLLPDSVCGEFGQKESHSHPKQLNQVPHFFPQYYISSRGFVLQTEEVWMRGIGVDGSKGRGPELVQSGGRCTNNKDPCCQGDTTSVTSSLSRCAILSC